MFQQLCVCKFLSTSDWRTRAAITKLQWPVSTSSSGSTSICPPDQFITWQCGKAWFWCTIKQLWALWPFRTTRPPRPKGLWPSDCTSQSDDLCSGVGAQHFASAVLVLLGKVLEDNQVSIPSPISKISTCTYLPVLKGKTSHTSFNIIVIVLYRTLIVRSVM